MNVDVNRRYRLITTIALLLVVITALSAGTRHADGAGRTLEEAKLAAQLELASQLSLKVSSQQRLMTSVHASSDKMTSEEFLYQDTKILVDLELLGVQYTDSKTTKDSITVTAYVDESSLPQYLQKLSTIKRNIEEIEQRITQAMSLETQKTNLALLLRYYEQFEAYSSIARALNNVVDLPLLQKTKAGAELDYLAVLNTEVRTLQIDLHELQAVSDASIVNAATRQEARIKMQEIVQQIEETQRALQAWDLEQKQRQQELLQFSDVSIQKSVQAMREKADSMKNTVFDQSLDNDPLQFIRQIEEKKQTYLTIQNDLEFEYKKQSKPVQDLYVEEMQNLEKAPYRTAEMVAGIPTDEAKIVRKQKIAMTDSRMREELEEIRRKLAQSVQIQQQELLSAINVGYKNWEKKFFSFTSSQTDVSLKVGTYDGYRKSWPVAVRFSLLDRQFSYDMYIPYEKVTGLALPSFDLKTQDAIDSYSEYLDQVDLFEAFFSSTKIPLLVEIFYQISPSKNPSEYLIIPVSANMYRSDTGSFVFKYSYENTKEKAMPYGFTPITDIQTEKDYWDIKETNQAIEQEKIIQDFAKATKKSTQFANRALFYRDGFFCDFGLGFGPANDEYESFSLGYSATLSTYYTPINNVYFGLSVGGSLLLSGSYDIPMSSFIGVYPLVGFVFPVDLDSNTDVVKVFGDIRFGLNFDGSFGSALTVGVGFEEFMDLSVRVFLNGAAKGFVSISIGMNLLSSYWTSW